jgi:hypothetical protein
LPSFVYATSISKTGKLALKLIGRRKSKTFAFGLLLQRHKHERWLWKKRAMPAGTVVAVQKLVQQSAYNYKRYHRIRNKYECTVQVGTVAFQISVGIRATIGLPVACQLLPMSNTLIRTRHIFQIMT